MDERVAVLPRVSEEWRYPRDYIGQADRLAMQDSDAFFDYKRPTIFRSKAIFCGLARLSPTPVSGKQYGHGQWFPAKSNGQKRAVVPVARTGIVP